ncbi:unnamed protein product [Paramecium sonneborni]|uniref:Uncharacterized protein n=1 Tax=Paramecium sonneborni TaxID=65129 RepID=A0A8S1QWS1_9CILI|nr:unnamed protein product [Paramecium sonneborni]
MRFQIQKYSANLIIRIRRCSKIIGQTTMDHPKNKNHLQKITSSYLRFCLKLINQSLMSYKAEKNEEYHYELIFKIIEFYIIKGIQYAQYFLQNKLEFLQIIYLNIFHM